MNKFSILNKLRPGQPQEQEFIEPEQPPMREPIPVDQSLVEPPLKHVIPEPVREMPPDEVDAELAIKGPMVEPINPGEPQDNPDVKKLSQEELIAELMKYMR
jgi:hypothetical protein